jgi:hypothetical protein
VGKLSFVLLVLGLIAAWMFRYECCVVQKTTTGIYEWHRNRFTGAECLVDVECW